MATGVGSVIFPTSFTGLTTKKNPDRHKDLGDMSYTSRAVADFIYNFVAMGTRFIRG